MILSDTNSHHFTGTIIPFSSRRRTKRSPWLSTLWRVPEEGLRTTSVAWSSNASLGSRPQRSVRGIPGRARVAGVIQPLMLPHIEDLSEFLLDDPTLPIVVSNPNGIGKAGMLRVSQELSQRKRVQSRNTRQLRVRSKGSSQAPTKFRCRRACER